MNNSSYRDQVAMVRRIRSYRLLVVSWRLMFLSAAAGALAVLLRENDVISQAVLAVLIAPIIVVYCLSFFVVIGAGAIHSVQSSAIPLGRASLSVRCDSPACFSRTCSPCRGTCRRILRSDPGPSR